MNRNRVSSAAFSGLRSCRWEAGEYLSFPLKHFISILIVSLCFGAAYARPSSVAVSSSSGSELALTVSVRSDLSDLRKVYHDSATFSFARTFPIMTPTGGSAVLISSEGFDPLVVDGAETANLLQSRPEPLVSLSRPYLVRGRTLVTVRVHPVVGSAVYSKIQIRVGLSGGSVTAGTTSMPDPVFDRIFDNSVVNYADASRWSVAERASAVPPAPAEIPFAVTSSWAKLAVNSTGLHRVTGSALASAGVSIVGASSSAIRMFSGGGEPIPFDNSVARPEWQEISIMILDGGDGRFDNADQIVWFAEAANRWKYRPNLDPTFVSNIYTDQNVYWLTSSGSFGTPALRIGTVDGSVTGNADTIVTEFESAVHAEQDNALSQDGSGHTSDYYTWYWTDAINLSVNVATPGAVVGDSARVYLKGWTGVVSSTQRYMTLRVNGVLSPSDAMSCGSSSCNYGTTALVDGSNVLSIGLTPVSSTIPPYFDLLNLFYKRNAVTSGDKLDITIDASPVQRAEIRIQESAAATPLLFDLADRLHPIQITGFTRAGGQLSFEADLGFEKVNRYYYGTLATAASPTSILPTTVENMRAASPQTDLIIVTPQRFLSTMNSYVSTVQQRGYAVKTVAVEAIMDDFGFGMEDPSAIRDFLKYAYETYPAPAPSAVLFVGDANYDFRDRLETQVANLVPSYINPIEGAFLGGSYSDDNYVFFGSYGILDSDRSYPGGDRGYDMLTARWPVRSAGDIQTIISKIRTYEASTDFGPWRTNVTLVADDEFGAFNSEAFHVTQTEELEKRHLPREFNRRKVYLWDYPFVNSLKPGANEAILDAFNSGTLMVNYVGHGNPDVWAHERVFTRSGDLPKLQDNSRLPLVYAASCAIGYFDDPLRQAMGEDFMTLADGGAIGVISAMRIVFSSDNAAFNRTVYDVMMYNDSLTIGEAFYTAKLLRQYGNDTIPQREDNDRAYVYFGDPLLRLGSPRLRLQFTESPDSLVALGVHHVAGVVTDQHGAVLHRNGSLQIAVYDSDRQKTHNVLGAGGEVSQRIDYKVAGPTVFNGSATVTDGHFAFDFVTPLDIGFGGSGARITAYAALDSIDAVFLRDSLTVSQAIAENNDSVGPTIRYTVGDRTNFVSGDAAMTGEALQLTLIDSSGINLAGAMGHGITLEVDGQVEETINLTSLFAYVANSYQSGSLTYPLAGLSAGTHEFKIRAWDNANNVSTISFSVDLQSGSRLAVNDLLNHPNPMRDQTTFYFELTRPAVSLSIEVFTLSGRRIWAVNGHALRADNYPNGDFSATWKGRDSDGSRVASGVYIYKATAAPDGGGEPVESFGKIVVVN